MFLGKLGATLSGNLLTVTIRASGTTIRISQDVHPLTNFQIQMY